MAHTGAAAKYKPNPPGDLDTDGQPSQAGSGNAVRQLLSGIPGLGHSAERIRGSAGQGRAGGMYGYSCRRVRGTGRSH